LPLLESLASLPAKDGVAGKLMKPLGELPEASTDAALKE
jgi:hypothetical protein